MPNIGAPELIVILLVALMVFGPRKLPELGKSLGGALREFKRHTGGLADDLRGGLNAPSLGEPWTDGPVQVQPVTVRASEVQAGPGSAPRA